MAAAGNPLEPMLAAIQKSTDLIEGMAVCVEALKGLPETLEEIHDDIGEELAADPFDPTEENLAIAAAKRQEYLEDIKASVAAIIYTDRLLAEVTA